MKRSLTFACTIALCAPLYVATAGVAIVALGERIGASPFAGTIPQNSAEAAALGRAADLLRFGERSEMHRGGIHGGGNVHEAQVADAARETQEDGWRT